MRTQAIFSGFKRAWSDWRCSWTASRLAELSAADLSVTLADRIRKHLADYAALQMLVAGGVPADKFFETRDIIRDARNLAFEISLFPGYKKRPPLDCARYVLTEHWRTSWTNGGISESAYRGRLKGAILFLQSMGERAALAAAPVLRDPVATR